MQFKFDPKVLMPHLVAVTLFYLLPLFYFSPVTQGYSIIQGDISSFKGMAKSYVDHRETYNEEALWTDAMFSGMPAYQVAVGYFSNVLRYIDRFISIHLFWEGPHLLLFLCMVSFYILCITLSINPWLSIAGAIGFGFSSYFPILIEAGHNAKLHAIAYLPGALAGFLMVLRGNFIRGGVLFGCFMSLEILSNHIQVTYYFGLMLAIFLAFYGYDLLKQGERQRLIRALMVLIAAGSLAVLSNAAILWNTYRYAQETMRGGSALTILPGGIKNTNKTSGLDLDYLTQWSQGISETWSLLIPEVKGGGSGPIEYARGRQTNAYWGEQPFTSGPVYAGAFLVFLFLLGFFVLSGPYRWAALVASLFFLMIAWGKNMMWFTELLADYLPMYNKFRTPSMALLILELLIPLSAVMVLSRLGNVGDFFKQKQIRKPVLYTTGILVAILLLVGMSPDSFFDLVNEKEAAEFAGYMSGSSAPQARAALDEIENFRAGIVRSDALRSLFFLIAGLALTYFFAKKKDFRLLGISIAVLCLIDLWIVDKRYVNNEKKAGKYLRWEKKKPNYFHEHLPSQADESILDMAIREKPELAGLIEAAEKKAGEKLDRTSRSAELYILANERFRVYTQNTHFRVYQLNNPFNESRTSFFHKSIGGYSAVKMGRYQDLIDFYLRDEAEAIITSLRGGGQDIQEVLAQRTVLNMLNTRFIIYSQEAPALSNPNALGNAWFVKEVQTVANADEEILALGDIAPRETAVIQTSEGADLQGADFSGDGSISLVRYKANELVYTVDAPVNGFAVFSEIYYKHGWVAYCDGKQTPHYKVNYLLRGIPVPAGTKEIVFRFEPVDYPVSNAIGYASSIFLLLSALALLAVDMRRSMAVKSDQEKS